jgi:hypothetical protein
MIARRDLLKVLAGSAIAPALPGLAQASGGTTDRLGYGWDEDVVAPTKADLYVAPDGDDGAKGTLDAPLRTIQIGIDRLSALPGGSLAIRKGTYREAVYLDALRGQPNAPYRIHRYGNEHVTICAAEVLTGWKACTDYDAATLGIPVQGVYVVRIRRTQLEHETPLALNMHEAGIWLSIATDRADTMGLDSASDYRRFSRGQPILNANGQILGFTDPALKGRSIAQMTQVRVLLHHAPNIVTPDPIAAYDPATGTIQLADRDREVQREQDGPVLRYSLQNVPTALAPGRWIIREEPNGDLAIYLVPIDPAHLEGGIEISTRETCIDIGNASNVELFGLEMTRAAGGEQHGAVALRHIGGQPNGAGAHNLKITHCRIGDTLSTAARGEGALYLRDVTGIQMHNFSLDHVRGSFGMFLNNCSNADLRFLHLSEISQSPARFFGLRDSILAFSLFADSAWEAHANKFNFYQGSDRILVYGVRCQNTGGYSTYQKASRIFYAFCDLDAPAGGGDNRVLASQNIPAGANLGGADGSGDPVANGTFWYWNLTLGSVPNPDAVPQALLLGPEGSSQRHSYHNCVLYGGGNSGVYLKNANPKHERRSHNHYTGLSYWQNSQYNWRLAEGEAVINAGQQLKVPGLDMRAVIAKEIAPLFPTFTDWDRDIDYRQVDWSAPPIGAQIY